MASAPARAAVLTLGLLLGGIEAGTGRHPWRRPTATTRSYFAALERWGYVLSDVERLVLADPDADPEADAQTDARTEAGTDAEKPDRPAAGESPSASPERAPAGPLHSGVARTARRAGGGHSAASAVSAACGGG